MQLTETTHRFSDVSLFKHPFNPIVLHPLHLSCTCHLQYLFFLRPLLHFLCFKHLFISYLAGRRQFARHEWAQKAAYLLGCTLEELSSSIFKHQAKGLQHSTSFRGGSDEAGQGESSGKDPHRSVLDLLCKIMCTLTYWHFTKNLKWSVMVDLPLV